MMISISNSISNRSAVSASALILLGDEPSGTAIDFADDSYAIRNSGALQVGRASDLLTVSRASPGMRYNAAGLLESVANNLMRFDHDPVTKERLGVLIEGQRTNLVRQSTNCAISPWVTAQSGATAPVCTANAGMSPDGTNNATRIDFPAVATTAYSIVVQSLTGLSAAVRTHSVWLKAATPGDVGKSIYIQRGAQTDLVTYVLTADWVRVKTTGVSSFVDTGAYVGVAGSSVSGGVTQGACSVLFFGYQAEDGPFPSSYIPTSASQVTRAADNITLARSSIPYDDTQVSIMLEANWNYGSGLAPNTRTALYIGNTSTTNFAWFYNGAGRRGSFYVATESVGQATILGETASAEITRMAARLGANNAQRAGNGVLGAPDVSVTLPAPPTIVRFGSTPGGGDFHGHIRRVAIVPRLWSDAELVARSTP